MRKLIHWWLALLLGGGPFTGFAAGLDLQSQWLEDTTGGMTLAQVQASEHRFRAYTGVLNRGYSDAAYWIKLRIPASTERQLVLRIRPTYLDQIELHDPLMAGSQERPLVVGDRHRRGAGEYLSLNHGFVIPASEQPRAVYLRLQTTSSVLAYVELFTPRDASQSDRRQELVYSMYVGLLLAFLAWAVLQWFASRELLIAAFLGKQTVVLLHALAVQGYLPTLLDEMAGPGFVDAFTSVLFFAYVGVSAAFTLMLLREFEPAPWLWWIVAALLSVYLPIATLFWQGQVRLALQLNMVVAAVESVGVFLVAWSTRAWRVATARHPPPLSRGMLISFNVALVAAAYSAALPNLGGMRAAEWTLHSPMFAGFITSLLMTVLLGMRARNLEKRRHQVDLEMKLLEQQAQGERLRREEQEQFLAMLTHELKTPLGVARISLDASTLEGPHRARITRALSNINAIIDRCAMTDQLEHRKLNLQPRGIDLAGLLAECVQGCSDPARVKVLEGKRAPVRTDSGLMAICLGNLLDNALKYSPPESSIYVSLQAEGGGFAVRVRNLVGAAGAPDVGRLFQKYYRSPGALSKSGSGLGLYLSRNLADMLGGRLTCGAEVPYVEFCLWVPA